MKKKIRVITDIQAMQDHALAVRQKGLKIAFVPTMGYLHQGHLSLLQEGRRRGDTLVLSIFVNPAQFGAGEDLDRYPRDFARDEKVAASGGVDVIFAPEPQAMYPRGYASWVDVEGLTDNLCGRSRPGHFRGVTTVVCKLFQIVQPHVALFGRKDFQQLAVIRRMSGDLNIPVEIVGMPIVRETDGLAMSSRNVYLSPEERRQALALPDSLRIGSAMARAGERRAAAVIEAVRERIASEPDACIDYVQICHADSLLDMEEITGDSILLLAARIGKTRLIDNSSLL